LAEDLSVEPVDGDADKTLLTQAAQEHQHSTNLLEMWRQMPYRDSWSALVGTRFWSESSISSYADQMRQLHVPVYIMGGWHDELRDQGIIALLNLPESRILIGPWRHCMNPGFELLQEIHRFFDTYLKGLDTGLQAQPRVHYFTMNAAAGSAWQAAPGWPVPGERTERWFLGPHARLDPRAPVRAAADTFTVRTDVDCPQGGVGPFMQPCLHPGQGLSVASAALAHDRTITGNPIVNLRIRVDRPDANLFAYLTDVGPDGSAVVITEGRLKASLRALSPAPFAVAATPWHRSYAEDSRPLLPGQAVTLQFDLLPTSYRVPAGHRIGLTVMGADYRERLRDPSVAGTTITVLSAAADPSWLDLPVASATP
jgi:putative CocE/NonD family hydrolase